MPMCGGCPGTPPAAWSPPCALLGGRGLLRISLRFEAEDEGVRLGEEPEASRIALLEDGDAAPSLESLFFLEDLLGSLPRDSY